MSQDSQGVTDSFMKSLHLREKVKGTMGFIFLPLSLMS